MIVNNIAVLMNITGNVLLSLFYFCCYRRNRNPEKMGSFFTRTIFALALILLVFRNITGPGFAMTAITFLVTASFILYLGTVLQVLLEKRVSGILIVNFLAVLSIIACCAAQNLDMAGKILFIMAVLMITLIAKSLFLFTRPRKMDRKLIFFGTILLLQVIYLALSFFHGLKSAGDLAWVNNVFVVNSLFDFTNLAFLLFFYHHLENPFSHRLKDQYEKTIESINDGVFVLVKDRIIHANAAAAAYFRGSSKDIVGKSIFELSPSVQADGAESKAAMITNLNKLFKEGSASFEWTHRTMEGSPFLSDMRLYLAEDLGSQKAIAVFRDITKQKKSEEFTKIAQVVFDNSFEGVYVLNGRAEFEFVNNSFLEITGFDRDDIIGHCEAEFRTNIPDGQIYREIEKSVLSQNRWEGEIWSRKKDGSLFLARINVSIIKNSEGGYEKIIGSILDITDYQKNAEKLQQYMNFDPLTHLINRESFITILDNDLKNPDREIVFLDIDINNFKYINDTFGHSLGDNLLIEFSIRLKQALPDVKMFCRYSADEFLLYFYNDSANPVADTILERILASVKNYFIINGEEVYLTVSIGLVSVKPDGILTANTLIRNANTALHDAKRKGSNQYSVYNRNMQNKAYQRLKLENDLRAAIDRDAVTAYFQGKYEAATGKLMGMETLARWISKNKKVIPPSEFLPLAEKTNLIYPMTEKLMEIAGSWTAKWNRENNDNLRVAINLSARHFRNYDIIGAVDKIILSTGIDTKNLELEITESAFLNNTSEVFSTFDELKKMGVHISLDDFGTGYSSFSYLKNLPIDSLKIDKSFIDDIEFNPQSGKLLKSILNIARDLNLKTVAEGVETLRQKEILQELGCDMLQGYYFSKPVTPEEFREFLLSNRAETGA